MDKVEVDRNNNNEVKITADGVNVDDEDVKDAKLKVSTMGMDKVEVDRNNGNEVEIAVDESNEMDEVVGGDNDANEGSENTSIEGNKDGTD